jgi:cytoskeleton protein RodZ
LGIVTVVLLAIAVVIFLLGPSKPPEPVDNAAAVDGGSAPVEVGNTKSTTDNAVPSAEPSNPKAAAAKTPLPEQPPEPGAGVMHVDLEAREAAWVSITDVDGNTLLARVLQPNETRSLELTKGATLRTGNAGALVIRFNGKDIGPLGPVGKIRDVEFKDGTFRIRAPNQAPSSSAAE